MKPSAIKIKHCVILAIIGFVLTSIAIQFGDLRNAEKLLFVVFAALTGLFAVVYNLFAERRARSQGRTFIPMTVLDKIFINALAGILAVVIFS